MILAPLSFVILIVTAAIGIAGQWSGLVDAQAWRLPAAVWLVVLMLEGYGALRHRIRTHRTLPEHGYLGRAAASRFEVHNAEPRALRLEIAEGFTPALADGDDRRQWSIPAHGQRSRTRQVTPVELGEVALAPIDARMLGRFRLAWWRRRLRAPASMRVVPDALGTATQLAGSTAPGAHRRPVPGPGRELFGLRNYRRGDPLAAMDWKATARRGKPVVRIHEADEQMSLVIAVDVGRGAAVRHGALTRLGHHVNVAARLAEEAIARGDHVAMLTYAESPLAVLPAVHGQRGLLRIRETLAAATPVALESNPVAAALRIRRLVRQRALVLILTDVEAGEADEHLLGATALLARNHLPLVGSLVDEDVLAMRWRAHGDWRAPYRMLAAIELTRAVELTCLRLRRAGARVVRALPRELDARIRADYALLRARHGV